MNLLSIFIALTLSLACTFAEESKSSDVTKLEVVDLGEVSDESDVKISESQRKRDSGYVYNRPDRLTAGQRFNGHGYRQGSNGYRAKIVSRYPSQSQRPFTSYGTPVQSEPVRRPSTQYSGPQSGSFGGHQNHLRPQQGQFSGQQNQQNQQNQYSSGQFAQQSNGFFSQRVPSPVRHVDFVPPNPIASQNDQPFGSNTALYLPPQNQELPTYSTPSKFQAGQQSFQHQIQSVNFQQQDQTASFQDQSSNQGVISDAANFLSQNAQAISQLYGAPATDQNFAPNNEDFSGGSNQIQGVTGPSLEHNNQFQNQQFRNVQSAQRFQGSLPSYASGTLGPEESLEQIQSKEKDRLIAELQTLLSQSQSQNAASAELIGQYAQSHGNYIENQKLLAAISSQLQNQQKYNNGGQNANPGGSFGPANTAFGQAPFVPGTSTSPTFTLGYGLTTQQTPTTTTTTTTTTASPIPPSQSPAGSSQSGSSVPAPSAPSASNPNFPQYGGFVPSLIGSPGFVGAFPSYGTVGSGFVPAPVQPAESSPTHFGLPIPQDPNAAQQPQTPGSSHHPPQPVALPSSPSFVTRPAALPVQPVHPVHPLQPVHPVQPIAPLHPISTTLHGVQQFHPILNQPLQPVASPVHPVLPAVAPVHTAPVAAHPSYGIQPGVFNPLLYKPVKNVYPVYYYPNLPYQVQKPALPTYPWSYAPSYAQAKPAQIWK
ncbi:mediator of RNA polymerase II transcription subunit 15 [Neodiprion pinetum]|uniref:mediator of RNA polymerase II transcription subunit 15 n=1 Tax=Neodiprion pinetum TaxID=441929 RepID=UPI001EE0ED8E|nr:PHD finger protein rhinoceros-like [Neodiprion pinetum]